MKKITNFLIMALLAIGMVLTSCDEQLDNAVIDVSLEVETSDLVLSIGESATRICSTEGSNEIIYESSKPAVATVDKNGMVKALSDGEAIITISMEGAKSVSFKVIVNKAMSAAALKDVDKSTPLTLVAAEDGKITVYFNGGITLSNDIKYTVNGGEEQTISKNTEDSYDIVLKKGDVVQFYSTNTSLGGGGGAKTRSATRAIDAGAKYINIRPSMKTEIYGNVMSLLKGKDNLENAAEIEGENAFYGLFSGADKLVNSEDRELVLPATSLKEGCYDNMFNGCKGIEKAPELPAPTLEKGCYKDMFADCSKLTYVKCLATDLSADGCLDGWLEDAGKEAEETPVIETAKDVNWDVVADAIPDNFEKTIAVDKITFESTTLKLVVGNTATLKATLYPVETSNKNVEWSTSNRSVAMINPDGLSESLEATVTAVSIGTTTITVCTPDGSVKATCQVTVEALPDVEEDILVNDIWTPQNITVSSRSTTRLSYSVSPENATNKSVTINSDNPSVVSVNENGDLSTHGVTGIAHITISANDGSKVSATCTVTVKSIGYIYFMTEEVSKAPESAPFINPFTHVGDGTVTFSSSDTNVASVNSATGEVTITPGATAGQTVNIMATISESETNDYIYYSKEASYTLKLTPANTQAEIEGFSPGSW